MRVISGNLKGMRLKAVPGTKTRPTSDKVKEALFHRVGPYFDGGIGLDLYGGSGSITIEAISRGLEHMHICDISKPAIATIQQNLQHCRVSDQVTVHNRSSNEVMKRLGQQGLHFDFVFLDPPYDKERIAEDIANLQAYALLSEDVWLIVEHRSSVELPDVIENVSVYHSKRYRDTTLTIYI